MVNDKLSDGAQSPSKPEADSVWHKELQENQTKAASLKKCATDGAIEFDSPYPASCLGIDNTLEDSRKGNQPESGSRPTNWTVVVDLAWKFKSLNLAELQGEQIAALKNASKGKDVSIVVQIYGSAKAADGGQENQIRRIMIHDGRVTDLGQKASEGEDITDLLKVANRQAPSKHIALIVSEDGLASHGFMGDSGKMTLSDFSDAVKAGLDGSGHSKLDLLDLDACMMGDTAVMDKIKSLSNHIIASSDLEALDIFTSGANLHVGQNLPEVLRDLLAKPKMSSDKLLDDFIKRADEGEIREQNEKKASFSLEKVAEALPANATLAHFNINKIDAFQSCLNKFGMALRQAGQNENNLAQIKAYINSFDLTGASFLPGQHELGIFIRNIEESIKKGEFKDADGSVMRAAQDLERQCKHFVSSRHIDSSPARSKDGGLAIFLPDTDFWQKISGLGSLEPLLQATQVMPPDSEEGRIKLLKRLDERFGDLRAKTPPALSEHLNGVIEARKSLDHCSLKELSSHLRSYEKAVRDLGDDQAIATISEKEIKTAIDEWFASNRIAAAPAWNNFIEMLKNSHEN